MSGSLTGGVAGHDLDQLELVNGRMAAFPHLIDVVPAGSAVDGEAGSVGAVTLYSAVDTRLERPVTVRLLPQVGGADEAERFDSEARLLGRLSMHPNIVTVYDAAVIDGRPYLVTERTDDANLADIVGQYGPVGWRDAVRLTLELCTGLEQIHEAGLLHGDLRPGTVELVGTASGSGPTPKLGRFGLSLFGMDADGRAATGVEGFLHRAPEVLANPSTAGASRFPVDERSDLYSLTSVLFELIDGHAPYWRPGDDTLAALKLRLAHEPTPRISPDAAPPSLSAFIEAGLSPDPVDRPQTAAEYVRELALVREGRRAGAVSLNTASLAAVPESATAISAPADGVAPVELEPPMPEDWPQASPSGPNLVYGRPALDRPDRSPLFAGAMAVVAVGLVGLIALVTANAIDSSDQASPNTLPNPAAAVTAEGIGGLSDDSSEAAADDQMGDATTMPSSTTTTLISGRQTTSPPSTAARAAIPDLSGMAIDAATTAAADVGLQVLVVSRVAGGNRAGTVIDQKPDPGAEVSLPATMTLFIPRAANLPTMVGRSANAVCIELQALSLACRRTTQYDETAAAGSVIATSPPAGSPITDGATIEVTVSRGPVPQRTVPDLAGLTRSEAETFLTDAGFTNLAVSSRPSDNIDANLVVATNPAAGTSMSADQRITIQLSSGPQQAVTVPNVQGLTPAQARAELLAVGLNTAIERRDLPPDNAEIGKVVAVRPAVGAEVASGSAVTLVVGRQQQGTTTTTTAESTTSGPETTTSGPASTTSSTSTSQTTTTEAEAENTTTTTASSTTSG